MNPYHAIDAHHNRQSEQADARDEWTDGEATAVVSDWNRELQREGIILDIDMEEGDILLLAKEWNMSRDDALYKLAWGYVVDNEEEFSEPDYSAYGD